MLSPPQAAANCPRLAFDVVVSPREHFLLLERGEDEFEVSGLEPAATKLALDEMRGDRTLEDIGQISGLTRTELDAVCQALAGAGMLTFDRQGEFDRAPLEAIEPNHLVDVCEEHFAAWKTHLFSGPLWVALADGDAPRSLFLGWLIESYFFIEAATARLPIAIAAARPPAVRRLFAKHFCEEFDHHHFFRRGLEAAGIDLAMLEKRTPLPSTLAIRNHMRDAGRRDPLCYAACSGFLESTGEDHGRAHEFFDRLAANFDQDGAPIVGPLADHARLDEQYQHCGMLRLVADAIGPVTRARADAALEATRLLVETLDVWSTDILRHYGDSAGLSGGVRRYRPVDYGTTASV